MDLGKSEALGNDVPFAAPALPATPQESTARRNIERDRPFWCTECLHPFPEQQILDHHRATVHPPYNETRSGGISQSRTPISCLQCSKAKAGCDKKRPCSRCKAKRIACCPRFARRTTKDASQQRYRTARQRASVTFWIAETPLADTEPQLGVSDSTSSNGRLDANLMASQSGLAPRSLWRGDGSKCLMKMPGPKSPDQMALATSAAAAGQTAGPLPPQDGDIQCEPIWPLMPGQAGEELPFQAINRSNSLPSDYLPTPARSPTEMWDRRHGMTHSRIISESIIVPRAKSTTSTFFAQNNEIGPKIGGQWHVAQCVSPHDASGDERENFLSWLLAKTSQPEAWESFDQHIATRAAYFGCVRESPVGVSESYLRSTVCDHIKAATIMAGSGALESWPYGYTASSEHIVHALPSEPSFRYILSTGLDALSGDDLFERHPPAVRNSPYDPLFRHLVPLVLAQGLLVSESQEARRLALGLLDAEVLILEGELGITIECSQHSTRRSLFLRVAAFSGHGQYMQMAERQHMSRLIHTRSLISNDTYSMDCDGSYRLDLELSMVFGRAPAIAAMAIVPENDDVGSAITQVSTRDERHPRRDTMLAAQDWLKTNAQCLPSQSPIPELEPLEDDLEAILGVINKQAYHARQLWTITNVGSGLVKPESFPHAEIAIRHWLSRWHQAFIAGSQTVKMTARRCKLLWLYSLVWLTWLADVPAIERKSRRVAADQAQAVSGNGQIDRDVDLMQIHCGQIFRLAQITNCTQPLWWPLAIYRATLIVWDASMSPQQKGSQSTIDPNLILSTDLGPFEVWPLSTTAIDELPLEDDHLQSILNGHRDLNGTLSLRDGSKISLDHPKGILEYGIDVLEHGSSSLLRDGVIMRLKGMQMAWYGE